ncbi:MAG: hypothetical protein RLW61_19305 [Gammaproteobacteria bacterium]
MSDGGKEQEKAPARDDAAGAEETQEHLDEKLDEALDETFPASDPIELNPEPDGDA